MTPVPSSIPLRRRRRSAGFSSIAVLFAVSLTAIAALVLISTSLFQVRTSVRGENRSNALMLAEAGIDDAVQRMQNNLAYGGTQGAAMTMFEDPGSNSRAFGNFDTTVTRLSDTQRRITSVGRTANGAQVTVHALVDVTSKAIGSFASVTANGNVTIGGTADVKTVETVIGTTGATTFRTPIPPSPTSIADVFSNANVIASGSSTIDGQLQAVGTVSGTMRATMGGVAGVPPFPFPSTATTDAWKADWISKAGSPQTSPKMNGNKQVVTVTAPAYINGDIKLNSDDTLEFKAGPDPAKNVIYVSGSVVLGAQSSLINGVSLVVNGTFEQQGGGVYKINTAVQKLPKVGGVAYATPSLNVYGINNGVPASGGTMTIKLVGGSANTSMGVIYAVNGDIDAAGNATYVGALAAGGPGGQVKLGGGFQLLYPNDLAGERQFARGAEVSGIIEP